MKILKIALPMIAMLLFGTMVDSAAQARAEKTSSAKAYYGSKPVRSNLAIPKKQKQKIRPNKRKSNSVRREVRKRFAMTAVLRDVVC